MTNLERGEGIVSAAPQLYVDIDVEADGKPGYGSLLSVGATASRYIMSHATQGYSLQQEKFCCELKPANNEFVPSQRKFCEKNNLTRERLLEEGLEPAEALGQLVEWEQKTRQKFDKDSSVAVCFNASFDFPWIDLEMIKAGIDNPFGNAGYCIKSLAQILAPDYDWRKTSKGQLSTDVLPGGDFTHNALEDAIYQQGMHYAMIGKIDVLLGAESGYWNNESRGR